MTLGTAPTGAAVLAGILAPGDALEVSGEGRLAIAGHDAAGLLDRFGSPLSVIVADALRTNLRRIRAAFEPGWPAPVRVLYAIKANDTLAIRTLLSREGAGGDCFGLGELHATMMSGADPARVVMNGSNKDAAEIAAAVAAGVTINVDSTDEIAYLRACCANGNRARVDLRLKVLPTDLDRHVEQARPTPGGYVEGVRRVKWGFTVPAAADLLRELATIPGVDLAGYSCHIGHLSSRPEAFAAVANAIGQAVTALRDLTGFVPRTLDIGGGYSTIR